MSRYQPYPSYKESGVQWFGEIPNNWQVLRNKMLFEQTKTLVGSESSEYTLLSLTKKGVIVRDLENAQGKFPAEFDTYQIVKPDDLIFCLFDIDETPRTVGLSYNTGMITGAYTVFKSKPNIDPAYVHYYYLHIDSFKGLKPFYSGLRKTIRPDAFLNIEMPCPSSEEQTAIANFLDHETAKIDTLIAKQERMIELLNEKRSAIISHAVTKGLGPNAKMKDSGVEWLGEVPEHWEIKNAKYVLNDNLGIKIGPFGSALKLDDMVASGYKVYGQENVIGNDFSLGQRYISDTKFTEMIVYKVEPKDILITMMGTIGKCQVVPDCIDTGIIDSHLIKLRMNTLMLPDYFVILIDQSNLVKTQFSLQSKGSIMQGGMTP